MTGKVVQVIPVIYDLFFDMLFCHGVTLLHAPILLLSRQHKILTKASTLAEIQRYTALDRGGRSGPPIIGEFLCSEIQVALQKRNRQECDFG